MDILNFIFEWSKALYDKEVTLEEATALIKGLAVRLDLPLKVKF